MIDAGYDPHAEPIYEPDLWLVASPDGVNWLVEDLADPTDETAWFPHTAAINGDVVIVGGDAGWTRYTLS